MSVFTESKKPYELLVRWGADGKLSGAHVGFITRTLKDGAEIAHTIEPVMPVAVGAATGFPLLEILQQVQVDAIVACDAAVAAKGVAVAERDAAVTAKDAAIVERDAVTVERDAVIAERDAAQSA